MRHIGYARGLVGVTEEQVPVWLQVWASKHGVRLGKIYQDEYLGYKLGWTRLGIIKLIEDAERGDFEAVWVEREEIHPGIPDVAEILESLGVTVMIADKDPVPKARPKRKTKRKKSTPATADEEILALRAQQMSEGRRRAAEAGRHQGPCPFGYKRLYPERLMVPEEPYAATVKEVFRFYLSLRSMKRTIRALAEGGYLPRRAKEWSRAGVAYILKNRTYLGEVSYDEVWRPGIHEPLIPRCTFGKVQAMLKRNNKRNTK